MHVIWDWNGTLFDDLSVVVDSVNAAVRTVGSHEIDADDYRTHYRRPVHLFYETLVGRPLSDPDWHKIDDVFHSHYRNRLNNAKLTADARTAIRRAKSHGATQSILSMWAHNELLPAVDSHRLTQHMIAIQGSEDARGEGKAEHLRRHLDELVRNGRDGLDVAMIGDALDDADAAAEIGIQCVLYDGGSHHYDALATKGVPIAATLVAAIDIVLDRKTESPSKQGNA